MGNLRQVESESGVSNATWRRVLKGQPVKRLDKKAEICDYLGWPVDGIDQLLAGQKVRASRQRVPQGGPRRQELQLDEIQIQLDAIQRNLARLVDIAEDEGLVPPHHRPNGNAAQ